MFKSVFRTAEDIPATHWELQAPDCSRDLVIKKLATLLIAIINIAALGSALYFLITYCPVPTQAILVSPFIVGVLGALAYLKFPTLGVTSTNYSSYLNPLGVIGRGMAYLFFGPLTYAINKIDWTPYHDPFRANRISQDLAQDKFQKIADTYGEHFDNLVKYGFIHDNYLKELQSLNNEYKPLKKGLDFYKKEYKEGHDKIVEFEKKIEAMDMKWKDLKSRFIYPLPYPETPALDFDKNATSIKLKAREYCCIGNPLAILALF